MARQPMTVGDMALAARAPRAFRNPGWVFEPEYDGVRALGRGGRASWLVSLAGDDLAALFPEVLRALAKLPRCLVDGEVVATDYEGRPDARRLAHRLELEDREEIALAYMARPALFFAFDLTELEGEDLRDRPLLERKALLKALLRDPDGVRYVEHVAEDGLALLSVVEAEEMAGIVARRADSAYRAGKSTDWMTIRTTPRRRRRG
jgi:bifunctional non-homologous end joining protein LigD